MIGRKMSSFLRQSDFESMQYASMYEPTLMVHIEAKDDGKLVASQYNGYMQTRVTKKITVFDGDMLKKIEAPVIISEKVDTCAQLKDFIVEAKANGEFKIDKYSFMRVIVPRIERCSWSDELMRETEKERKDIADLIMGKKMN